MLTVAVPASHALGSKRARRRLGSHFKVRATACVCGMAGTGSHSWLADPSVHACGCSLSLSHLQPGLSVWCLQRLADGIGRLFDFQGRFKLSSVLYAGERWWFCRPCSQALAARQYCFCTAGRQAGGGGVPPAVHNILCLLWPSWRCPPCAFCHPQCSPRRSLLREHLTCWPLRWARVLPAPGKEPGGVVRAFHRHNVALVIRSHLPPATPPAAAQVLAAARCFLRSNTCLSPPAAAEDAGQPAGVCDEGR